MQGGSARVFAVVASALAGLGAVWHVAPAAAAGPVTTDAPYRSIVYLEATDERSGAVTVCTGAFVGPNVVLTAARCVYGQVTFGGYASRVAVYPGRDGVAAPYGHQLARDWIVPTYYALYERGGVADASAYWNMAAVVLPDDGLGRAVGSLPVTLVADPAIQAPTFAFAISSYGVGTSSDVLWEHRGAGFLSVDDWTLAFRATEAARAIGAPVLRVADHALVGLNTGEGGRDPLPNVARRVDTGMLAFLRSACLTLGCRLSERIEPTFRLYLAGIPRQ